MAYRVDMAVGSVFTIVKEAQASFTKCKFLYSYIVFYQGHMLILLPSYIIQVEEV